VKGSVGPRSRAPGHIDAAWRQRSKWIGNGTVDSDLGLRLLRVEARRWVRIGWVRMNRTATGALGSIFRGIPSQIIVINNIRVQIWGVLLQLVAVTKRCLNLCMTEMTDDHSLAVKRLLS